MLPLREKNTDRGNVPDSNAAGNTMDRLTDEIVQRVTETIGAVPPFTAT